ncbi:MAG TPA: hypothetical protein VLA36_09915, partial [Longimicrobiales bacterium]|nr:hypothetical protein [Longimicrobiales bacterium]
DGALVAELGEWPDNEQWSSFDVDHGHVQDLLFGKRTVLAAGNDRFWVGTGEGYELRGYDRDGTLARIVRNLADEPRRSTPAMVSGRIVELQTHWGDDSEHMLPVYEGQAVPDDVAPYDQLAVDGEGNLWAREHPVPGAALDAWTVFDAGGRMLGSVAVPHRLELLDVGRDFVIGKSVDAMNVERVEVYRLFRSGGPLEPEGLGTPGNLSAVAGVYMVEYDIVHSNRGDTPCSAPHSRRALPSCSSSPFWNGRSGTDTKWPSSSSVVPVGD